MFNQILRHALAVVGIFFVRLDDDPDRVVDSRIHQFIGIFRLDKLEGDAAQGKRNEQQVDPANEIEMIANAKANLIAS